MSELDKKLIGEFDAKVWAKEFVKRVKKRPGIAEDEECMISWFANAIMTGYDTKQKENIKNRRETARDILSRLRGMSNIEMVNDRIKELWKEYEAFKEIEE